MMKCVLFLCLSAVPCVAQREPSLEEKLSDPVVQEAMAVIASWTSRARSADPDAWASASPRFRERIADWRWNRWATETVGAWDGVGAARVESLDALYDEPPAPPAEWVGVVLVHDRGRGGKVYERVWVVRENGERWAVVDYALWVDGAAIVTNAYVRPIPWVPASYGDRMVEGFHVLRPPR